MLARALAPYSRRPEGAQETRRLISTAWVEDALLDQEQFERLRNQQPFIFPETITTDRGSNYLSAHFLAACEHLTIGTITASTHTPTDKPHVERTFKSINTMFLSHVRGYTGRSVEHRGKDVSHNSDQLLTIAQMQELLEDWIAVVWQNKVHSSLRDPLETTVALSPNQMCRAYRRRVPELHIPLTREDFIALLPTVKRRINRYGVTIDHRVYDSSRLDLYRRRVSDSRKGSGRWSIRVDPYNLHVVWLDADGEFIPLHWSNEIHRMPMLGEVWRLAREEYRATGVATPDPHLAGAILDFSTRGNPKGSGSRSARVSAARADPMHLTAGNAPAEERTEVIAGLAGGVDSVRENEPWPNRGGFELIAEPSEESEG
ncbi:Mu transposase C-terminal domain-containing protein [Microbacterium sp. Root553]|uniref:Mu transposase C-terminal domain-containing protein n=1 Tax=Microbacterium sp. Root553 TaxID=1736556 RepID=UPI000B247482|nr:Mu transposase C-terminal domain-containing protein [Microbacterium sp. Root553]